MGNVTCFTMNNATGAADAVKVVKADVGVRWLKKKEWEDNGAKAAGIIWAVGTKLTAATQYLVIDPNTDQANGMKAKAGSTEYHAMLSTTGKGIAVKCTTMTINGAATLV